MKPTRIFKILIVLILVFCFNSCKKFLNEKPNKNVVELKTLDDLQALLDDNTILNKESTPGFGETSADDYFILLSDYNSFNDQRKRAYTWRLNDNQYTNDWSYSYKGIYSANYCSDYIEKIPRTSQNGSRWDNVKGSALFFRAYRYLNLVWEYGKAYDDNTSISDLGVVLRLGSDPSVPSFRVSVANCYQRIIEDAMEAVGLLPNSPQHVMRPSKPAAYGLLARTFLSMRKYDSAYKYVDLSLKIKNNLLDYNDGSRVNSSSRLSFKPFNEEIVFYTTQSQFYIPKNPYYSLIDTVIYNSFNNNDIRKVAFFYSKGEYHAFKGTYSTVDIEDLFTGIATDEMYIIRAECQARMGRVNEAMNDLNTLLAKRWKTGTFIPLVAPDQEHALNLILQERRKELLMRGLRWIDIKRLNKEGANIVIKRLADKVYTLMPGDDRYALPLPIDVLELTGMPQNPGWE